LNQYVSMEPTPSRTDRARGALLGQFAGDALGSLVEFKSPADIRDLYPKGVRDLENGGTYNTLAGQPTDDSELALMLARELVRLGDYDAASVKLRYRHWLDSGPFDCGNTIYSGLTGSLNPTSQANGAMMRVSPLGIFGAGRPEAQVDGWAREDAALTHPNPVCVQANSLYVRAIAHAIDTGCAGAELYAWVRERAEREAVDPAVWRAVEGAAMGPPEDMTHMMGWVVLAFQNALYQIQHATSLEQGVIDTVMRGGDTDTNAAIAGALLGAVHGLQAVPAQWREAVLNCRPAFDNPRSIQPRPEEFWPVDALELADALLKG